MKILDIRILRGPNYWSVYRKKLIDMKLDLGEKEYFPTNTIMGFSERLEKLMPTLFLHRCSIGKEGGFFKRVRTGTWLGHVAEHIAIELQTLAHMECGFGRTRSATEPGTYHVVFSYEIERAGVYAGKAAIRIIESIIAGEEYDLAKDICELERISRREGLGPSTLAIVREAEKRDIPFTRLDKNSFIMLGQGSNQRIIDATIACTTSGIAIDIVSDKDLTRRILSNMYINFPDAVTTDDECEISEAIEHIGFPLAIKPVDGNHGRGITTRIQNYDQALRAFRNAKHISNYVIIEKYIPGNDYRFLVINYKLAAVAKRIPPVIIGDGVFTIRQLIDRINTDPRRGLGHEKNSDKN